LKDAAKLLLYFAVSILVGALLAPPLFWLAQSLFPSLAEFGFERFFHRALLIAAGILLWPFLRMTKVRAMADVDLAPNSRWSRDLLAGFLLATVPLLCCGAVLVTIRFYSLRHGFAWSSFGKTAIASVTVPFIEEALFRGIILGVLLRSGWKNMSILVTSALYSLVHFLKAPERPAEVVTWFSGFKSIAHSFDRFFDPMLVASAFTTLFVIGWIMADARIRTRSLWMPIGLHAGWIFAAGSFNAAARRQIMALPWLGKDLLVGIIPLIVAALTWLLIFLWLKNERARKI
jgi:membrane protease YdiL (CAAX protease family)